MADNFLGDWRSADGTMNDFLNLARLSERFTDIQLVIGKKKSVKRKRGQDQIIFEDVVVPKTFNAHKLVLACGSPVFEKMFYGEMPDNRKVITIEDDDPEAFEMLLSYFYENGEVEIGSFVRAWKLCVISDKYLVSRAKSAATEFMTSTPMDEENFWEVIRRDILSCKILTYKIVSFIKVNACDLVESYNFYDMSEALIDVILRMDELNIEECTLLTAVTRWAYRHMGSDTNSKDLFRFLKYIRFTLLTSDDFMEYITIFPNAIDTESSLKLLAHLSDKKEFKLPLWCSSKNSSRKFKIQSARSNSSTSNIILPRSCLDTPLISDLLNQYKEEATGNTIATCYHFVAFGV